MITPWYATMGLLTMLVIIMDFYLNPHDTDWTKMKHPYSPEGQMEAFGALLICFLIWPVILFYYFVERIK